MGAGESQMYWAKRQFDWADYGPYQDRLEALQMAHPTRCSEFMMFSTKVTTATSEYYVGVPTRELLAGFDGFAPVDEGHLPKVVDCLNMGDQNAFAERFTFRHDL